MKRLQSKTTIATATTHQMLTTNQKSAGKVPLTLPKLKA